MSTDSVPSYTTKHVLLDAADVAAMVEATSSGDLSGTASTVQRYERALASAFGARFAVACSSGTAAIHLALLALDIGTGDEVIVPATAPPMTALPILAVGARPIFADVASPASFALDLADVERKLSPATKAAISVPMWGYPADGALLADACRAWGVALIEDAAQAHGTRVSGRLAGTQGTIGTFSTHARKLMTTGEGGFCLTYRPELAARLYQLRNIGQPARLDGPTGIPDGLFGLAFGLNYKLAAPLAALGTAQLTKLDQRLAARRRVANRLLAGLRNVAGLTPLPVADGGQPNHYALVATVAGDAAEVSRRLAVAGVVSDTTRYGYQPLYHLPVFAAGQGRTCDHAERLCASIVTIPCHEALTTRDQDRIVETCQQVMAQWA
ncbi:MAG: DegT/DnrJ/EryC1/StrS family aminotransferase [Egibacteraceae bacterium]